MELRKISGFLFLLFSLMSCERHRFSRVVLQLGILSALADYRNLPDRLPQLWLQCLGARAPLAA